MNIKIELFKACIFMLIGAYLCARFQPDSSPKKTEISQVQQQHQECKVVIKKTTRPDGSIDEVSEFLASNNQSQVLKVQSEKKHSILLIPKYNFENKSSDLAAAYTYNNLGIYGSRKEIGLVLRYDF